MQVTEKTSKVEARSETSGPTSQFRIGNAGKIISLLRNNLYAYKIRTCVQEYLSNARDAHREGGCESTPIQVTMPTHADATFRVRDFGPGLSPERVQTVFTSYGTSTKDQSDHETGGFGLGAKSAWAYTDSFIVTSYHGGCRRIYVCHIGDSNVGQMEMLDESPSSEPTGVEVQIALKDLQDIEKFQQAAYRATMFWDIRPEFVNLAEGELPFWYEEMPTISQGSNWKLYRSVDLGNLVDSKLVVALDGIPYPVDKFDELPCVMAATKLLANGVILVISVANGDLDVTGSRESLSDAPRTLQCLEKNIDPVADEIKIKVSQAMRAEKSLESLCAKVETLSKAFRLGGVINNNNFYFDFTNLNGQVALHNMTVSFTGDTFAPTIFSYSVVNGKHRIDSKTGARSVFFKGLRARREDATYFIIDDLPAEKEINKRRRLRNHLESSHTSIYNRASQVVFCGKNPSQTAALIKNIPSATLLSALELPERERVNNRVDRGGQVCVRTVDDGKEWVSWESLSEADKVVYWDAEGSTVCKSWVSYFSRRGIDFVGVTPGVAKRLDKLSNSESLEAYCARFESEDLLTEEEKRGIRLRYFPELGHLTLALKDANGVKDENFQEIKAAYADYLTDKASKAIGLYYSAIPELTPYGRAARQIGEELARKADLLRGQFPLLGALSDKYEVSEVVSYLNARKSLEHVEIDVSKYAFLLPFLSSLHMNKDLLLNELAYVLAASK